MKKTSGNNHLKLVGTGENDADPEITQIGPEEYLELRHLFQTLVMELGGTQKIATAFKALDQDSSTVLTLTISLTQRAFGSDFCITKDGQLTTLSSNHRIKMED